MAKHHQLLHSFFEFPYFSPVNFPPIFPVCESGHSHDVVPQRLVRTAQLGGRSADGVPVELGECATNYTQFMKWDTTRSEY